MSPYALCMRLLCAAVVSAAFAACGAAPDVANDAAQDAAQNASGSTIMSAAHTTDNAALLRKPPSLASTIYDVDCQVDADCALVPQGDVCRCAGFGAMRADNEDKFLQRRARLGARCPDARAPVCTPDKALFEARCRSGQCVATAPRAFSCVDARLDNTWPLSLSLGQSTTSHKDEALSMCPAAQQAPYGDSEVFLLHPQEAGKYRIVLTDKSPDGPRPVWLIVRTPDCQSENVACRLCQDSSERCLVDEVLGPDDTAVIVVRHCDSDCTLQVGQWDAATPLVPPL